jgi:hypothetical protein
VFAAGTKGNAADQRETSSKKNFEEIKSQNQMQESRQREITVCETKKALRRDPTTA